MTDLAALTLPDDRRYSEDHEWVSQDGELFRVGISDFAQDQLGDVVYVDLPQAGDRLSRGDAFGSVESAKSVSDLVMPLTGEVLEVNADLDDAPELINDSPYDRGWLITVRAEVPEQYQELLAADAYRRLLEESG